MASSTREISALIILLTKYYIELYFVSIANHKPCSFVKTCSRFSVRPEHVSELRFHDKFKPFSRQRCN